jgi:hypothetical protein
LNTHFLPSGADMVIGFFLTKFILCFKFQPKLTDLIVLNSSAIPSNTATGRDDGTV